MPLYAAESQLRIKSLNSIQNLFSRFSREDKTMRLASLFFFLSGAAALVYEIIWLKLLGLVFGNTTFAISTVLAAYMAGLGFGSYLIGRQIDAQGRPLFRYGVLEVSIGIYAAATFLILGLLDFVYVSFAQLNPGLPLLTAARFILSFFVVFIPTFFMGGTFPVLVKFLAERKKDVGTQVAALYGINTLGAVVGTVSAGFLLLPALGLRWSLAITVILNVTIGLAALFLSSKLETKQPRSILVENLDIKKSELFSKPSVFQNRLLFAGLFISGAAAMLYEIGWTRVLASVLGSSTYAFTTMLATFLLGIGLGSVLCKPFLKNREIRWSHWAGLQILISAGALSMLPVFPHVPLIMVRSYAATIEHLWLFHAAQFGICLALMILPAIGFGALFPLSAGLYAKSKLNPGQKIGALYLVNTLGNIAGSVTAGFLLIPAFGIHRTLLIAIAAGIFLSILAVFQDKKIRSSRRFTVLAVSALLLIASWHQNQKGWNINLLTGGVHMRPQFQIQNKEVEILRQIFDSKILFYKEGLNSIVSVSQLGDTRILKVNGKPDASTGDDMQTQLLLGHLPHLLHSNPQKTLVIGFGSGTTLDAALAASVQKVDCVELEPAVIQAAPLFEKVNHGSYKNPRTRLILNDGRNHLKITDEIYDVIISEPSNPWMAGVSSLFSVEFYKLAEKRLKNDGILCQWLQEYCISPSDFRMIIASVRAVFPHVTLWRGATGDVLILSGKTPIAFDWEHTAKRWEQSQQLRTDLEPYEITGPGGILSYFLLGQQDTDRLVQGAVLNTDNHLLLEYNAPMTLYEDSKNDIERMLLTSRTEMTSILSPSSSTIGEKPDYMTQIGMGHVGRKDFGAAKTYFQIALAKNASHEKAREQLARCYIEEGKHSEAAQILTTIQSSAAARYLSLALTKMGQKEVALKTIEKAISMDDKDWENFAVQGNLLGGMGKWQEAADAYQKASQLRPDSLLFKLNYAEAQNRTRNYREALNVLVGLQKQYQTFFPIYSELQKACLGLNSPQSAITAFEIYNSFNPYNVDSWKRLVALYRSAGNLKKSYLAYRQVQKLTR